MRDGEDINMIMHKDFKANCKENYREIKKSIVNLQKECQCGEKWVYFLAQLGKLSWVFTVCLLNICNKIAFVSNIT